MKNLELENVNITDADETFWKVDGLKLKNVKLHDGTYPFMFSKNIYVDGLESDSKYVFQYCRNVEIHNATSAASSLSAIWTMSPSKTAPLIRTATVPLRIA